MADRSVALPIAGMRRGEALVVTRKLNLFGAHISSYLWPSAGNKGEIGLRKHDEVVAIHSPLGTIGDDQRLLPQGFAACDDVDFALRVRERGYRNESVPTEALYHHESFSYGEGQTEELPCMQREIVFMQVCFGEHLRTYAAYNPILTLSGDQSTLNLLRAPPGVLTEGAA